MDVLEDVLTPVLLNLASAFGVGRVQIEELLRQQMGHAALPVQPARAFGPTPLK